jgi:hypothetical protein
MKHLIRLVVLVLIVGAGYLGFKAMSNATFGVSGDTPLGSIEQLDPYFTGDLRLMKSQIPTAPETDIRATAEMLKYVNVENPYESIVLYLDQERTIRAIVATYWMGDFGSHSPVFMFAPAYWRRMGGTRNPAFTETREGRFTTSIAEFETGSVRARWQIIAEEGQRQEKIFLQMR